MAKTTDTSERGLERLICTVLTGHPCDPPKADQGTEPQAGSSGVGWSCGSPHDRLRPRVLRLFWAWRAAVLLGLAQGYPVSS